MKLQQALHPNLVKRLQHMIFIGKITEESDHTSFYIKCLSRIPEDIQNVMPDKSFIFKGACTNKQNEKVLANLSQEDWKKHIFLFRFRYHNTSLFPELLQAKEEKAADSYEMIPVPYGESIDWLERKLAKGYVSFVLPKFSSDFDMPELLMYGGRVYGNLSLKSAVSSIMYWEQRREVVYYDIDNLGDYSFIKADDYLYFIAKDNYDRLKALLAEKGKVLIAANVRQGARRTAEGGGLEFQFLQYVKERALAKRLYIEDVDLYNLHLCLKTSPITIVGGMPGIGKSQLVKLYGEALGLQFGKELIWIPIAPSYQEPQDVLGYYHPNGTYIQSETGLVKVLLEAAQHPEKLYFIIFDEMNVAHIEHWFTPFLSLLELEEQGRVLSLYTASESSGEIPPSVPIRDNVYFIGTVNFDETTKELSDRLLDRVNIMTFQRVPFREALLTKTDGIASDRPFAVSAEEFKSWSKRNASLSVFTEEELELLDSLHEALQLHDPAKGISFRTAIAIAEYISNIPKDDNGALLISRDEAFDLQIKQRVLTKLRGMEAAIAPLLMEHTRKGSSLLSLLQSPLAKEVSAFAHSIACLKQKQRELELYGYAK